MRKRSYILFFILLLSPTLTQSSDGGDGDSVAIGGDLVIQSAVFRDTDGTGGGVQQIHGIQIDSVGGSVTLTDNTVTGNRSIGASVTGGTTVDVSGGSADFIKAAFTWEPCRATKEPRTASVFAALATDNRIGTKESSPSVPIVSIAAN